MQAPRHLRVFVSSPGDVAAERGIARDVLGRLPYDPLLRGRVTIEVVAWDGPLARVPMVATATPQDAVARGLARPSECDVVILILWRRLGTPLPDSYRRPDGTRYASGTEWEYEDALRAPRQPVILVYRRTADVEADPGEPDPAQARLQYQRVQRFFDAFQDADGSMRGGINVYANPEEFGVQLDFHLREILSRLLAAGRGSADLPVRTMRLDAATRRQSTVGRPTQVRVQVCHPASAGLLRDTAGGAPGEQSAEEQRDSRMPVQFRRDATSGALLATPVSVDLFAPSHDPVHATEELLLLPSHDSGVVSFGLEPRQAGVASIRVTLRQQLDGAHTVTCGTVVLEPTVVASRAEAGDEDDVWHLVSRFLGDARAAAAATDPTDARPIRLTLRVVEETERRKVEKYLTLDVPLLCAILPITQKDSTTIFNPADQQATGIDLFERLRPALVERLRHDEELLAFLREHPDVRGVDLVLLIEDRIAAVVPDNSPRVVAAIIAKIGLDEFIGRPAPLPPGRNQPSVP